MKCTRPTQFQPNGQYLSCGQCMPCRITRRLEWQTKLTLEYLHTKKGAFITLTYAPEHLPNSEYYSAGELQKKHLQDFIKRFRRNYQYKYGEREIRFFGVGEYGDKSERAHYHAILFNVDPLASEEIVQKSWKLGHSMTAEIKPERIKYIVGYTIKKMTNLETTDGTKQPEFSLMSRRPALGSYSLDAFAKHLTKRGLASDAQLTQLQKYHLTDLEYTDHDKFNGWFKHNGQNLKLDRGMLEQLGKIQLKYYDNLAESIDSTHQLLPKKYRAHLNRLHDDSKLGKMKEFLTGERYETQKKADKIKRQYNSKRTL